MTADIRRVRAVVRKEWINFTSYRVDMILQLVDVWYFAISFYFIGEFVGDPASIGDLSGGYFEFVLIGSIVTSFAVVGMASFSGQIREEQNDGTLEAFLTTPSPAWTMLAGSYVIPAVFVVIESVVLVVVGLGVFGSGIPVGGLILATPILFLTAVSFIPFGVISAAFIVLVKRGDPFGGPIRQVTLLLSGALYPLSVLPGWLQSFSALLPATYGVRATRDLVQDGAGITDVWSEVGVLLVFIAAVLPVSLIVFRSAVRSARRAGTLGTY